jgi:hypothetical protein
MKKNISAEVSPAVLKSPPRSGIIFPNSGIRLGCQAISMETARLLP